MPDVFTVFLNKDDDDDDDEHMYIYGTDFEILKDHKPLEFFYPKNSHSPKRKSQSVGIKAPHHGLLQLKAYNTELS